jgi:hypothetical protein
MSIKLNYWRQLKWSQCYSSRPNIQKLNFAGKGNSQRWMVFSSN